MRRSEDRVFVKTDPEQLRKVPNNLRKSSKYGFNVARNVTAIKPFTNTFLSSTVYSYHSILFPDRDSSEMTRLSYALFFFAPRHSSPSFFFSPPPSEYYDDDDGGKDVVLFNSAIL
uniref:Ovule protein n=1 Tax=Caenorhabditis tropicalis TaxID=1561998 RepID=A0A1I7U5M1_9PELO